MESEALSVESVIMLVLCFVTVGILTFCLFAVICCNYINSIKEECDTAGLNATSSKESGVPIRLKENPTSVTWIRKTNSWRKKVSRFTANQQDIEWV